MPQVRAKDDLLPKGWIGQVQSVWIRWCFKGEEMTTIDNRKAKTQFETKCVLVTPNLAEETLKHNKKNRTLTQARVDEFVGLMKAGLFQCTHQGIALDDEGNVIDGQHLLSAIVKSKCSVYMLVSKGVPEETRLAVDTGKSRSPLAIAKIVGRIGDTNPHYAIARVLKLGPVKSSQAHVPAQILFGWVDTFHDGIDAVLPSGNGINATILSVIARASYTKDRKRLKEFIDVYKTSQVKDEGDTAAIKLKLFVLNQQSLKGSGGAIQINARRKLYEFTQSAVMDFLNHYPTKVLQQTHSEKFPLPQELDGWN